MKQYLLLLAVIIACETAIAQELQITPKSSREFKQGELREIIRKSARNLLYENHVPLFYFDQHYDEFEVEFLKKIRPTLVQKFKWVESTGLTYRQRELYLSETSKGVRDVLFSDPAFASLALIDESDRILNFFSDVHVGKDGWLDVSEHIAVYNGDGQQNRMYLQANPGAADEANDQIRHGLAREIPTLYRNRQGLNESVPFQVISVTRDGQPENYYLDELSNGVRIRMGNADSYLDEGIHEYVIKYKTTHQIAFFEDKDELYWNVTGSGWAFSIDAASCRVIFPASSKISHQACYTGAQGSTAHECSYTNVNDSTIVFKSNIKLEAYNGLTIGTAIEKGVLVPPATSEVLIGLAKDNWPISAMFVSFILLFAVNMRNWLKFGKDPSPETIVPQFEAPPGISPADAGFLYKTKYIADHFSAALVDIAIRKGIRISTKQSGKVFKSTEYHFLKGEDKGQGIKNYVKQSYRWTLSNLYDQKASKEYNSAISDLNSSLREHLESQFQTDSENYNGARGFFALNSNSAAWGFGFLFLFGVFALIMSAKAFTWNVAGIVGGILLLAFIMQYVFYKIMPAYNVEGRRVLEQILGLRMYLSTAEEKRFDKLQPPVKDLELFEKFLPYAIALECQNEWSRKFEDVLKVAGAAKGEYTPYYYDTYRHDMSSIGDDLSSGLSSAVSSASVSPSSGGDSSYDGGGSDGGGSSGGGGGGGGGGGW